MNKQATYSSETWVGFILTTQRYISDRLTVGKSLQSKNEAVFLTLWVWIGFWDLEVPTFHIHLTYKSAVNLQKLVISRQSKKFFLFYRIQNCITLLLKVHCWPIITDSGINSTSSCYLSLGLRWCKKYWNLRKNKRSMYDNIYKNQSRIRPPIWSSGQSSWLQILRSGFNSRCYQIFWEAVGLERGPFGLVSIIEELLERNSSDSGLESREYDRRDPSRWPRGTLYLQNLALTSPTSGGRSVGIVSSRTEATEFTFSFRAEFKKG
jgi:hypothetical protein